MTPDERKADYIVYLVGYRQPDGSITPATEAWIDFQADCVWYPSAPESWSRERGLVCETRMGRWELRFGDPIAEIERLRAALADAEAKLVKARDDALEEAAKVTAMVPSSMIGSSETYPKAYKDACYHAAAAIRSLKSLTDT